MYPETWKVVQSILLLHWGELESVSHIYPAINVLRQSLSNVQLTLLTPYSKVQLDLQDDAIRVVSFQDWDLNYLASDELNISDFRLIQNSIKPFIRNLAQQPFDASIVFANQNQSPYVLAYFCYLAGIPIRLGQSHEFGGGVLSTCVKPLLETDSLAHYHLHLLKEAGFSTENTAELAIA